MKLNNVYKELEGKSLDLQDKFIYKPLKKKKKKMSALIIKKKRFKFIGRIFHLKKALKKKYLGLITPKQKSQIKFKNDKNIKHLPKNIYRFIQKKLKNIKTQERLRFEKKVDEFNKPKVEKKKRLTRQYYTVLSVERRKSSIKEVLMRKAFEKLADKKGRNLDKSFLKEMKKESWYKRYIKSLKAYEKYMKKVKTKRPFRVKKDALIYNNNQALLPKYTFSTATGRMNYIKFNIQTPSSMLLYSIKKPHSCLDILGFIQSQMFNILNKFHMLVRTISLRYLETSRKLQLTSNIKRKKARIRAKTKKRKEQEGLRKPALKLGPHGWNNAVYIKDRDAIGGLPLTDKDGFFVRYIVLPTGDFTYTDIRPLHGLFKKLSSHPQPDKRRRRAKISIFERVLLPKKRRSSLRYFIYKLNNFLLSKSFLWNFRKNKIFLKYGTVKRYRPYRPYHKIYHKIYHRISAKRRKQRIFYRKRFKRRKILHFSRGKKGRLRFPESYLLHINMRTHYMFRSNVKKKLQKLAVKPYLINRFFINMTKEQIYNFNKRYRFNTNIGPLPYGVTNVLKEGKVEKARNIFKTSILKPIKVKKKRKNHRRIFYYKHRYTRRTMRRINKMYRFLRLLNRKTGKFFSKTFPKFLLGFKINKKQALNILRNPIILKKALYLLKTKTIEQTQNKKLREIDKK